MTDAVVRTVGIRTLQPPPNMAHRRGIPARPKHEREWYFPIDSQRKALQVVCYRPMEPTRTTPRERTKQKLFLWRPREDVSIDVSAAFQSGNYVREDGEDGEYEVVRDGKVCVVAEIYVHNFTGEDSNAEVLFEYAALREKTDRAPLVDCSVPYYKHDVQLQQLFVGYPQDMDDAPTVDDDHPVAKTLTHPLDAPLEPRDVASRLWDLREQQPEALGVLCKLLQAFDLKDVRFKDGSITICPNAATMQIDYNGFDVVAPTEPFLKVLDDLLEHCIAVPCAPLRIVLLQADKPDTQLCLVGCAPKECKRKRDDSVHLQWGFGCCYGNVMTNNFGTESMSIVCDDCSRMVLVPKTIVPSKVLRIPILHAQTGEWFTPSALFTTLLEWYRKGMNEGAKRAVNRWEKFDYLRHGVEDLRRKFAGGHPLDNVVVEYVKEGTNPLQSDCYNCEKDLVRMDGAAFGTLVYVTVPLYVRGCPVEPHGLKLAFRMTSNAQVGAENEAGEKTTTPRWKWQANLTLNDSKQWCSFYPGISKRNPLRMERNPRRIDRLDDLNEFLYDHMGEKHQAAPPYSPAV